jgi:tight adherence protein C
MIELLATSGVARVAFLVGVFALIAFASFVAINLASRVRVERGNLAKLTGYVSPEITTAGSLRARENETAWGRMVNRVESAGLSLADTKDVRLRQTLKAAGFISPSAPRIFTLARLLLVFALPAIYLLIVLSMKEPSGFLTIYLVGSLLGLIGLFLPNLFVRAKADRRTEAIVNGFPDCLDLMLVCIEAGLGIEAAMDRVGREMVRVHPLVAELLSATVLKLRAGATRQEAFRTLADESGVDEINSFATLLIQSDKLGTSIGSTLRVYAAEMREKRRMRAEEKAYRLPVLISIPLVVFMLPVMIGVLMLPASIRVVREVAPMLAAGG